MSFDERSSTSTRHPVAVMAKHRSARLLLSLLTAITVGAPVLATVGASPAAAAVTGGACNAFSGARSLGAAYTDSQVTIPTCGPRPFSGGSQASVRPYPGALTTPGYQCVEFSERYLFYKYNVTMPIGTNGSQIVDHYVSRYPSLFTKIGNGTANAAPQQGDVLSFSNFSNFSSDNGHTAVVSSSAVDGSGNGRISIVEENASASGNNVLSVSNWVVQPLGYRYTKWLHRPVAPAAGGAANLTANGGFEGGGWSSYPGTNTNHVAYRNGQVAGESARSGLHYMATNTSSAGGGVYEDIPLSTAPGGLYCGSAWVRSQTGATGAGGQFVLWLLGGSYNENGVATFSGLSNGSNWRQV